MRKFLSIILFFTTLAAFAQTPVSVLDKAVSVLKSSGTVTASYSVVAKAGTGSGTIAMSGVKYRILAHGMKAGTTVRRSGLILRLLVRLT
jgi:predicted S18 family serine protease